MILKKICYSLLYAAIVIAIILCVWAVGARVAHSQFILPGIGETFDALKIVLKLEAFRTGLEGTLLRSLFGYLLSLALAAALFYVSSIFKPAAAVISPLVSALRTLPTMAVSLLLAIWAGARVAPVVLGVLVIMPMLYSAFVARTATLPVEQLEIARLLGAGRSKVFFYVTLPYAAGALPESLSSAFSFCIKIVLAAEILMQTAQSLGMLMFLAQTYLQTAMLIAFVLVSVVVAVVSELVLRAVLKLLLAKYME